MKFNDQNYFFKTDDCQEEVKDKQEFIYRSYYYYRDFFKLKNIFLSDEKIFLLIIFDLLSQKKEISVFENNHPDVFEDDEVQKIRDELVILKEKIKTIASRF